MAQANDSILVTPGSGETIATHLVNSKEHEVMMLADANGTLLFDPAGCWAICRTISPLGGTNPPELLSLLNASSTVVVDLLLAYITPDLTSNTSGFDIRARLARVTAHSGGTTLTPIKLDTTTGSLDSNITIREYPSSVTTSGSDLTGVQILKPGGTNILGVGKQVLWGSLEAPLVLRENEGVLIAATALLSPATAHNIGFVFRAR
jgi:hypothetical protein